tara:strand:+ start:226 stop:369 length:144 start_codon:yes stop_codon:yes gene_type:complete
MSSWGGYFKGVVKGFGGKVKQDHKTMPVKDQQSILAEHQKEEQKDNT